MDRFVKIFRRQTPVVEIIDESGSEMRNRDVHHESGIVEGYESVRIQQPNVEVINVKRKPSTAPAERQDDGNAYPTYRPYSDTNSFRTVLTRASDGKLVWVQRPVRDSVLTRGSSMRSTRPRRADRESSAQSFSGYKRGTMSSYLSPDDVVLEEERRQRQQQRRHSRRDGSATTTNTEATVSAASGDIQIGHEVEIEDDGYSSQYTASEYGDHDDERLDCADMEEIPLHEFLGQHQNTTHEDMSNKFFDSRGVPQDLPTPISAAYFSRGSTETWNQYDKPQVRAREAYHASTASTTGKFVKHFIRFCMFLVALLSVVLPIAFLALGIIIVSSNGKSISSGWSLMASLAYLGAALWPVALAAVVAQCLKAWITTKAHSSQSRTSDPNDRDKQSFSSYRLEVVCLLLVLAWCLSPLGSQALLRLYGVSDIFRTDNANVWYVDRTGYNQVWSDNATSQMSSTSRSELMQIIGEQYLGTLTPGHLELGLNGLASAASHTQITLANSNNTKTADSSTSDSVFASGMEAPTSSLSGNTTFAVSTSYFKLSCSDWSLMLSKPDNDTSSGQMSYSSSQTLGMNMTTGYDNETHVPTGTLNIVSLNRAGSVDPVELAQMPIAAMLAAAAQEWEYSAISCEYRQEFYSVPVSCTQEDDTGVTSCVQSGEAALIASPTRFNGTRIGDFSEDFVLTGNLPTTSRAPTATERFIQLGGPADPAALLKNTDTTGSDSLNLSSTVTTAQFTQRFEHLFNTWVSLGYCPQCTSNVLMGNSTGPAASLQPYYRRTTASTTAQVDQVLVLNWAWTAVFMVLAILLLVAGVTSVAIAVMTARAKKSSGRPPRQEGIEPQILVTNTAPHGGMYSGHWSQGGMKTMDTAAGNEWAKGGW